MTTRHVAVLLLAALVLPVSAADVSGNWRMTFKADWTSIPNLACTISQKDQRLEGTCRGEGAQSNDKVDLADGKIEGHEVSWTWKILVPDGVTWTFAFTDTVDPNGNAMKGIVKLSAGPGAKVNEASFTAMKQ
ncbi:MAG: hypothetical protein ACRD3G_08275 [Vicinamibacterales bacterium]